MYVHVAQPMHGSIRDQVVSFSLNFLKNINLPTKRCKFLLYPFKIFEKFNLSSLMLYNFKVAFYKLF